MRLQFKVYYMQLIFKLFSIFYDKNPPEGGLSGVPLEEEEYYGCHPQEDVQGDFDEFQHRAAPWFGGESDDMKF